jgi:Hsp70 protein.
MGRSFKDLGNSVNELPYQIIEAQRQLIKVKIGEKEYTPQKLSAEILKNSEI